MMKQIVRIAMVVAMGIAFGIQSLGMAAETDKFDTAPKANNGKKWRVGYYEGGEYIEYQQNLIPLVKALMEMGWINEARIPSQEGEQTAKLWQWMAANLKSNFIEFVTDGHYTANWDDNTRKQMKEDIVARLNTKKDIDLMLAMGTWAGQDLANDSHHTPTLAMAVSDAVGSGIVKSVEDSGYDHVIARVDPTRYERQIEIFHDIIGFQKLGVAYEDTVSGRSYAAIDKVEKIAKKNGFELVRCLIKKDEAIADVKVAEERARACYEELSRKADAIYVTMHTGVNTKSLPDLVKIFNAQKKPSFSQAGSEEVKNGLLMSISQAGFKYVGVFHAKIIAKIFNGAKPRQLKQIFEDPPKIALNLKTCQSIGYDPPVDILGAADEIFEDIEWMKK